MAKLPLPIGSFKRYTEIVTGKSTVSVKRKPGRPATGTDPLVGVRFPKALLDQVDAYAKFTGMSRSEAIRYFVSLVFVDPYGEKARAAKARKSR